MEIFLYIVLPIAGLIVGLGAGYIYRKSIAEAKVGRAEESVKRLVADAQRKAEAVRKETILEAKEEIHAMRSELERETKDRRNEILRTERRLITERRNAVDKKDGWSLESKDEQVNKRLKEITKA